MTNETDTPDEPAEYASPPCFMHELSADWQKVLAQTDSWPDVARWRSARRKQLIAERLALSNEERLLRAERIAANLDRLIGDVAGRTVSTYWPIRGEPDLRNWSLRLLERGGRIALPVVVTRDAPLVFRRWQPGDPLERGVWNILVPAQGEEVEPDIVTAPLVGFDPQNYRLGYGGGYFDRTLAAMATRPMVIGIGYASSRLPTIYPQPHDIAMSTIVTDS